LTNVVTAASKTDTLHNEVDQNIRGQDLRSLIFFRPTQS